MSQTYDLLKAGSTVTGDTWTMLNNLGSGGGIGQVISNIDGTVVTGDSLIGIIDDKELTGILESNNLTGSVQSNTLIGTVKHDDMKGVI